MILGGTALLLLVWGMFLRGLLSDRQGMDLAEQKRILEGWQQTCDECGMEVTKEVLMERLRLLEVWDEYDDILQIEQEDPEIYEQFYEARRTEMEEEEGAAIQEYLAMSGDNRGDAIRGEEDLLEQLVQQLTYVMSYESYLADIWEQAEASAEVSIFSRTDSFAGKNREKTLRDYEGLRDVTVELHFSTALAVEAAGESSLAGYAAAIFAFGMILGILEERKKGFRQITFATKRGRHDLAWQRIGTVFLGTFSFTGILYIGLYGISFLLYGGWENWRAPVQSLAAFQNCTLPISIGGEIFGCVLLQAFAVSTAAIILLFVCQLFQNDKFGIVCFVGILALEYGFYRGLAPQSRFQLLKYGNLFALFYSSRILSEYRNVSVWGNLLLSREWALLIVTLYCLTGTAGVIWQSGRLERTEKKGKLRLAVWTDQWTQWKAGIIRRFGLLGLELYKILIPHRGIWILLLFVLLLFSSIRDTPIYYSQEMVYLDRFYAEYGGAPNEQLFSAMEELRTELAAVESGYQEAREQYVNGFISAVDMDNARYKYQAYSTERTALAELESQRDYLESLKESRGIEGWYIPTLGYEYLLGDASGSNQWMYAVYGLLALILLISPVIADENQSGAKKLIFATVRGRRVLFREKRTAIVLLCIVVGLILYGIPFLSIYSTYGLDWWRAPVQSLEWMMDFPISCSIGVFFFGLIILRLMVLGTVTGIVCLASCTRNVSRSIFIACGALLLPSVFYLLGIKWMEPIALVNKIGLMELYLSGKGFGWLLFLVIGGCICWILSMRLWCEGRRGNDETGS